MNRQAGKVHWMALVAGAGIVIITVLALFAGESPQSVAARFMAALAKGDSKALADLSVVPGKDKAQLEKDWDFATQVAGRHYSFRYKILGQMDASANISSVRMQVWRNYSTPGSYEENFPLPLQKVNGQWKVQVRGMSRKVYPGLPR